MARVTQVVAARGHAWAAPKKAARAFGRAPVPGYF
jgi:hypothetical protein